MKKTYKEESRMIKRLALSARLMFRQRKILLDFSPFIIGMMMMSLSFVLSDFLAPEENKGLAFFVFCIFSIPMTCIFIFITKLLPSFQTLDEYIEHEIRTYLKQHSWRNVYMLLKKHKFPKIIEKALLKILFRKINRIKTSQELKKWIEEDGFLKRTGHGSYFEIVRKD